MDDSRSALQVVLELLGGVLDVSVDDLLASPVLATHDWDSITSLEALAGLERHFGIELDLRTFHATRTVHDVVRLVHPVHVDAH